MRRDFTAEAINQKWVGAFKQVNIAEGPVFLATFEDLFSRRMLAKSWIEGGGIERQLERPVVIGSSHDSTRCSAGVS